MSDEIHIGELDVGETAVLQEINLPKSAAERLMELGLLPGASIRLVRRAPLGCPIEFEVGGARLALRGADAANIFIQ